MTTTITPADALAAEFVIAHTARGGKIHTADCGRPRGPVQAAHANTVRRAAVAACCAAHEGRLLQLGGQLGVW
jgi:hypothetical protein